VAKLSIIEYHPESGAALGNISTLNFGKVANGSHTRVKVIRIAFTDVSVVGNIKLGVIANAGLTVNSSPTNIADDGSSENGRFGIKTSIDFDSKIASEPLSSHFAGSNTSVTAGDVNNVNIPNASDTLSAYIYLDIEIGASNLGNSNGAYKVFFDFS
jgi:hypothetical protein